MEPTQPVYTTTSSFDQSLQNWKSSLHFRYLPAYAQFILEHKLDDFVKAQLKLSREVKIPLLRFFESFSEEQILALGKETAIEFLTYTAENKLKEFIAVSIEKWLGNQIPMISRNEVVADDITLVSYIRRKTFRDFLQFYTSDVQLFTNVMDEIDWFTVQVDTISFKNLIELHQELYNQTQSIAHIGNWIWDLKSDTYTWSDELFNIYELEPQSEIFNIAAYNHPDDQEMIKEKMQLSRATLQPHDFYYRIILKDGKEKTLHAKGKVQVDSAGNPNKIFGTLQDVTTQKQIETELNDKQKFIQKVADITPSLIVAYNIHTGKYIFINHALEKLLGYTVEEVLNNTINWVSLIHPDDIQLVAEKNTTALILANQPENCGNNDIISEFQYRLLHKNGEYRWFHTYSTIFNRNKANLVEEVLNISVDITVQVNATVELMKKNNELETNNKELKSFSYVASHDLQEPLRKIQAFSNRILEKEYNTLSDWGKDVFKRIQLSANRMQNLIDALLNLSQINNTTEGFELIDTNTLVEEVIGNLNEIIEEKHAIIHIARLPVMYVIPLQFQQLITNILSNALKYSKPAIVPQIEVSVELLTDIKNIPNSHFQTDENYYCISVTDNGIGFEQQYAGKIFDMFQRLHGKSEYAGTGIGLSICKKIVENHHGFITAKGEVGVGATFNLFFPVVKF